MSFLILTAFVCAVLSAVDASSGTPTGTVVPTQLPTGTGPVITGAPVPQLFIPRPFVSQPANAPFPSVGSIPQDFSQQGYDNLWSLVSILFFY